LLLLYVPVMDGSKSLVVRDCFVDSLIDSAALETLNPFHILVETKRCRVIFRYVRVIN
jgi:hypothetical protein